MYAVNLQTEHLVNPIGIDKTHPFLSWNCEGGKWQTAYEIEAVSCGEVVWKTGKVYSNEMHAIYENTLASRQQVFWKVRLWDEKDMESGWTESSFEMGLLSSEEWDAKWINPELVCDPNLHKPASYLKKCFHITKDILGQDARLYITAHGLYEAWINDKRVGDFVLAPGCYDYSKHLAYQTYDVTELLCEGDNTIRVILGDGWYRSVSGVDGDRNLYGTDIALLLQLEIGGKIICISDESWQASQNGPIRENDMQQGEVIDARMDEGADFHEVIVENFSKEQLICSNSVPIVEMERFEGKLMKTPNGEQIIDFGQNLAGYIEFTLQAKDGDVIVLSHGETLDENGNFTQENFQDRKRHKEGGTNQRVTYTCREGINHYKTKFSIWGFRYAKVETKINLEEASFTAIAVYSKMEELSTFSCENNLVNQLVHNSIWSQKSNFCDVPTDCPTRERAAWTGDMGVFAHTGLYFMDCYTIIEKWLQECKVSQYEDGRVANIAPRNNTPSFFSGLLAGSVGWGDACIIVPYTLYKRYGDKRILEDNYAMMKNWYGYLERRAHKKPMNLVKRLKRNPYRKYTIETGIDYGEWCEPDVESTSAMRTPQGKVATAFLAKSGQMLAEIAGILDKEKDAAYYGKIAENARKAWRFTATENGKITSDRQADYVRAIAFNLLDDTEIKQAAADLNVLVKKNNYHLNTGFLSTPNLCRVLADNGYEETAYKLLLQDTRPSWLYEVKRGATTIWERWDGIDEEGKVKASLNHYSYGAICGWLFDGVCGITVTNDTITIAPHPYEPLGEAKATYQSPLGKISSSWKYTEGNVTYCVKTPANVKAKFIYPNGEEVNLEPEMEYIL